MISNTDRYYIERKYHDPEQPFDPFFRMAYHGIGYDEASGADDDAILDGLHKMEAELEQYPHPIARAKAVAYVMRNERLYINEHDWFVGLYSLNRLANRITFDKWNKQSRQLRIPELVQASDDYNAGGGMMIWTDYDHVVPDWDALMTLGFPGIRERARRYRDQHQQQGTLTPETDAYFEGIEIEYTAIVELLDRIAQSAAQKQHEKAARIAVAIRHLRDGAPTDFYEALMLIHLYFLISESVDSFQVRSLGHGLDQTLFPFYQKDLENGHETKEQIREFLAYFLLQWSAIGNYWGQPFYMGGTAADGTSLYNDLSLDILDVYDQLNLHNPKMQLKINTNTPDVLLNKAFDMVRRKSAAIVFCCEPGMWQALKNYGASEEEARQMDIRGCCETGVRANEVSCASGYINTTKAIEYVFTRGFDCLIQKQMGPRTQDIQSMASFDDFLHAYLEQLSHLIHQAARINNDAEKYLAFVNPSSMYSATIKTSLEQGRDGYAYAAKYNNSAMLCCGLGSTVDSLMAIKTFVFEKKELTLQQMSDILEADWDGYEVLRHKIQNDPRKYGNHNPQADAMAAQLADFFSSTCKAIPNERGGFYKASLHVARAYIHHGKKTGATPDGRKAGEEFSKNADPAAGRDKRGATAQILSALSLTPSTFPEAFCVDVMLHPSAVSGDDGLMLLKGLLMTYLGGGGMSLQFNVFDADTLKDAQQHPEKYPNLQIRVCGWNVLWNNMCKAEQDVFIKRAEGLQ